MGCNMRNGRKGDIRTCCFCFMLLVAAFLYNGTPSGNQSCVSGFVRVSRILEASPYFHLGSVYNSVAMYSLKKWQVTFWWQK